MFKKISPWIKYLEAERGFSTQTIRAYRADVESFVNSLPKNKKDPNQLTLTDDELRVVEDLLTFVQDIGLPSDIEDNEEAYDSLFDKVFGEWK